MTTDNSRRLVSWPAIFAGWIAAFALHILFLMFGAGVGFAIYTPLTDANPTSDLSIGSAVVQGLSAVVSLWLGGWVAGRLTPLGMRGTGGLHGFLVWCAATIAGVIVVGTGAGWAAGDISKLVGGGLSAAGKPIAAQTTASGAADLAKESANRSSTELTSFSDEAMGSVKNDPGARIRAKREINLAVVKLFNPAEEKNRDRNRAALVKTIRDNTNMSEEEADRTVTEWTNSYQDLKNQLEEAKERAAAKAREDAQEAARTLTVLSFGAFIAFAFGAVAAALGGKEGAKHAVRRPAHVII